MIQFSREAPDGFAKQPLGAVSLNGVTHALAGHDTETRTFAFIGVAIVEYNGKITDPLLAFVVDLAELPVCLEVHGQHQRPAPSRPAGVFPGFRESDSVPRGSSRDTPPTRAGLPAVRRSGGQALTAPLATAFENQTPAAGTHPLTEAVVAFPFDVTGLKSTFHDYLAIFISGVLIPRAASAAWGLAASPSGSHQ